MEGGFKPQETSMNSFRATEQKLYEHFCERGYHDAVARSIAHNFSQYMMGYITAEGAAQFILQAGADQETAREMAELFRVAKGGVNSRHRAPSRQYASAGG